MKHILLLLTLSACSSAVPPLAINAAAPQETMRGGSWLAKGIGQRDLLYVSNANGTVSVYSYWQRRIVGVLTNFKQPLGECVDRDSNVYVTDYKAKKIYEYAHGAKKPHRVIDDYPQAPDGCAVDLANGDLAIANYGPTYYEGGNITVYPHGTGKPIVYGLSRFDHFLNCAYNRHGDLLATSKWGYSHYYYTNFYYLPKGSSKLLPMNLPGPSRSWNWNYPQTLAWDGTYWVVDDYNLYRYTINIKAQYVDTIQLKPSSGYLGAVWLYRKGLDAQATQVVGVTGYNTKNAVEYWKYPAGGNSIGQVTKDLDNPSGLTVSLRTQ